MVFNIYYHVQCIYVYVKIVRFFINYNGINDEFKLLLRNKNVSNTLKFMCLLIMIVMMIAMNINYNDDENNNILKETNKYL